MTDRGESRDYLKVRRDMVSEGGPVFRESKTSVTVERAVKLEHDAFPIELDKSPEMREMVRALCEVPFRNEAILNQGSEWYRPFGKNGSGMREDDIVGRLLEFHLQGALSEITSSFPIKTVENKDDSVFRFVNPDRITNVNVETRVPKPSKKTWVWANYREYDAIGALGDKPFLIEVKSSNDLDHKKGIHRAMLPARSVAKMKPIESILNPDQLGYILLTPSGMLEGGSELVRIFRGRGGIAEELPVDISSLQSMAIEIVGANKRQRDG